MLSGSPIQVESRILLVSSRSAPQASSKSKGPSLLCAGTASARCTSTSKTHTAALSLWQRVVLFYKWVQALWPAVQVATHSAVLLFDMLKLNTSAALDECLSNLLHSTAILKLGCRLSDDVTKLHRSYPDMLAFQKAEALLDLTGPWTLYMHEHNHQVCVAMVNRTHMRLPGSVFSWLTVVASGVICMYDASHCRSAMRRRLCYSEQALMHGKQK